MAIREAVKLAAKLELQNFFVESDSKSIIDVLNGSLTGLDYVSAILSEIRSLSADFSLLAFLLVSTKSQYGCSCSCCYL